MSRFVAVTPLPPANAPFAATEGEETPTKKSASDPAERIVKYMPVEIVTGYVFVMGLVQAAPDGNLHSFAAWLVFAVGLIVTPIFLIKYHKPTPEQMPQV